MKTPTRLKLLLIKEKHGWTGQVLDVNVAFQFEHLIDMADALKEAILSNVEIWTEVGGYGPHDELPKAPDLFWAFYEHARPLQEYIDKVAADLLGVDDVIGEEVVIDDSFEVDRESCLVTDRELCAA